MDRVSSTRYLQGKGRRLRLRLLILKDWNSVLERPTKLKKSYQGSQGDPGVLLWRDFRCREYRIFIYYTLGLNHEV